jgi:hypothetical protein
MKKEELEQMINEGKSLNKISKVTGKSLTTVRYWVKKYELSKFINEVKREKKEKLRA